uniref:Uncharacterized protein n=2 Tax=Hordeum vulgare subsp. vulgare TaxID=112509 RepID=A0A8I7BDF2_HORVV
MPSLGSETTGEEEEEEADRRRGRMMELARACGELGTPPSSQRRASARLRPREAPAATQTQYELVKRPAKRKRPDGKPKREFNQTVRCSLKEFFECAELLKDRHVARVRKAGFGAMLDSKVRGLISRPLIGFLMGRIDPATMTMKLGESKVVAITSDAIHHLFGLPKGGRTAPRPSESGHDRAVMKLKQELGFKRSDNVMTTDLRGLLKRLVEDEEKDELALKVFFLVVFMKVICPGASARVSREAAMLEDLDFDEMADMDFCQLLVDELQRGVVRYQSGKALWQAITGCAAAPLLIYLDCCNLRTVSELDTRIPRTHFMTDDNLKKIASADLIQKGGPDTRTRLYGKLPWKAHKDIVYYELIVEPICLVPPIARGAPLRRPPSKKTINPQGAVADDAPVPDVAGSSNGIGPESERSNGNVACTALNQMDVLLARACDLSPQVSISSARLSHTKGILPPGHGFDAEAVKEGLSKEATLLYPGTEASPHPRTVERMSSLSSEMVGEEEVDRRRPEAEDRMMELARACGELGTPPYPQRSSSAQLRRPEPPAATQYKFVKRSTKRKRARSTAYENEADTKLKRGFNKAVRCSLKEFFECAELLKDRHLARVRKAGFGAMLDGKVRGLVSRPLMGFLMGQIDPTTMTMKLGESKVVTITSNAIHHLFGLPQGRHTAPRPSESGYDKAVMKLKQELGFKRSDIIMTRGLRGLLKRLVEDEEKDELALKVFFLVVFMKVICPGASARVSREAAMLEDLDFDKMADMDFCQLLVDELQRGVVRYQSGNSLWQGITGCAVAPLLIYLDCCNLMEVSELDTRTPRTHFMTVDNLKKIASADLVQKGSPDTQTWLYGKLPWKAHKDIVYYELIAEPICLVPPIARGAQLRRSPSKNAINPQGEVADDAPVPAVAGSSNGISPESERSNGNVAGAALNQIDVLLARACDLSPQVSISSARLSHTEGILPPGHGFDDEAVKEGLSKEAALLYPGTEASPDPRAAERMPSLSSETVGEEDVDRRRPEAEDRMMELARACGELGTPPYPQRRSSARLRRLEAPAATQYKFVKRSTKRKRARSTAYENEADTKLKRGFNKTVRCSLKEFFECAELLKDRHLARVRKAGFGAMLDGKVRGLISRPLMGFLMGKIDPATMTMKLGESKVITITSDAIHHLFGLPQGGHTAPRPSESGYDEAVMKLKQELGFKRSDIIMTRDLRGLLKRLVEDEEKDELALKVFFLVVFMKVICPGASARVSREAAMLEDLDFDKMADMDFCQLLVDELQRAVVRCQSGNSLWQGITGCAVAPLLIYLDCCNLRKVSELDTRTPRTHFMTADNLRKIAIADLIQKGGPDPQTWLYGKLPWKAHKDIVYYELFVEPIYSVPPIARSARLRRSTPKNAMDPHGAVADDDPAPAVAGSSNGVAPESERSNENVAATALSQIDVLLARACDLSRQVPTTSARLSHTEGILPPGHGFDAEAAKEGLSKEAALLDHLQKATFHLRSSFALFKSVQDDRCRPYEDEAKSFTMQMEEEEAAAAQGSGRGMETPADEFEENADHFMPCDEEDEAASPVSTPLQQDLSSDTDDDDDDSDYAG